MGKKSIYIMTAVIFAFLIILSLAKFLGAALGKKAEMISLAAVAVVLVVLLILNNKNKE